MRKSFLLLLGSCMFFSIAALNAAEVSGSAEPVVLKKTMEAVNKIENGGTLSLKGNFTVKDMGNYGFFIEFYNADRKIQKKIRFDGKQFIDFTKFNRVTYPQEIQDASALDMQIEIVANNSYHIRINGKSFFSNFIDEKESPVSIKLAPYGIFRAKFTSINWDKKVPAIYRIIDAPAGKFNDGQVLRFRQDGDFELSYNFKVEQYQNGKGHFNFTLTPDNKNEKPLQIVFWKKGFQVIWGKKTSKWLYNFQAPISDGKWHSFKLRHTGGDFWECYLDGKSAGSFEADLKVNALRVGAYDGWKFEVKDVAVKPYKE